MALDNPIFEASYRRLFGEAIAIDASADAFFHAFYDRFLVYPDIAAMFADVDLDRQVYMLRKSMYQLIASYLFDEPSAELQRLARIHRELGISAGMFDRWLEALVDTVKGHDPKFSDAVGLAWCWALTPGITYMKLALNHQIRAMPARDDAAAAADSDEGQSEPARP